MYLQQIPSQNLVNKVTLSEHLVCSQIACRPVNVKFSLNDNNIDCYWSSINIKKKQSHMKVCVYIYAHIYTYIYVYIYVDKGQTLPRNSSNSHGLDLAYGPAQW